MDKAPEGIKQNRRYFFYEETIKDSRIHDPDHCYDL